MSKRQQCRPILLVSIAITKQAFLVINIVKIRLRYKIEDKFSIESLMLYIEREIVAKFSTYSIIK
jgi:hypothetical protein